MLKKLSQRIVGWQIHNRYLPEADRPVYEYAYELLLNQFLNIVIAAVIGIVSGMPFTVLIFLVSYIPFRSYAGGYHSNTHMGCTVVSAWMLCIVCWMMKSKGLVWFYRIYPVIFVISGCIVFRCAPVPDKNKPLDQAEYSRYRKRSRIYWAVETIIGIACFLQKIKYGAVVAASHLVLSVMLCLGMIKNRSL